MKTPEQVMGKGGIQSMAVFSFPRVQSINDKTIAQQLWEVSESLVGFKYL